MISAATPDNHDTLYNSLIESGLYSPQENGHENTWRVATQPYYLTEKELRFFEELGPHLLKFYSVLNKFYMDSVKGKLPGWFAGYLDQGKPPHLVDYSRMKRFRSSLPGIIRPDVIVTENGFTVTELDSVPGGFGLTHYLTTLYQDPGHTLVGASEGGIGELTYRMMESASGTENCTALIAVSDEAGDYLGEMKLLGKSLRTKGFPVYVGHPREIIFKEEGLYFHDGGREIRLDVIYRFFECFDLKNIPKAELLMFSNKKGKVKTTPPYKPFLEEKLGFALFCHPALKALWENALGVETFTILSHLIPETWILDNRELPPHGVIPGLFFKGKNVRDWKELYSLTQRERELVIKTSGFSPEAWGSRGVTIGHDVSSKEWRRVLEKSLELFPEQPSILQKFHKGKRVRVSFFDPQTKKPMEMESRVRLTPYYFVVEGRTRLGGILATSCPHDKKKIHGMADAVLAPCAVPNTT